MAAAVVHASDSFHVLFASAFFYASCVQLAFFLKLLSLLNGVNNTFGISRRLVMDGGWRCCHYKIAASLNCIIIFIMDFMASSIDNLDSDMRK